MKFSVSDTQLWLLVVVLIKILESMTKQKMSDEVLCTSGICQNCFIKFNEIDEHWSIAQRLQDELLLLFEMERSAELLDEKPSIKHEDEEIDFSVIEVMVDHDGISEDSETFGNPLGMQCKAASTRSPNSERRIYKKKKNLDEGLIVVVVDGEKIYQCDICKKLCKDRYKLKTHREIHTDVRSVCCNECGALFKTMTCLYSHKKIHRERIYHQCDHCDMRYIQKTQLRKHMDAIHLKKRDHICPICGKCYSRDTTLSKHMFVHKEQKDVVCTVCGFRTHTKPKMERHMKSHTGERNYSCGICGKRFLYSYNVTAHVKHVHNREKRKVDEEKLTCKYCGKRFQKIWKVREHQQQVHQILIEENNDPQEEEEIKFLRANDHSTKYQL